MMRSPPPLPPRSSRAPTEVHNPEKLLALAKALDKGHRPSPPGSYAVRPPDSEPTNPGTPAATEARRRISCQASNEQEVRDLEAIVKGWLRMTTEDRVLVSALVRRLDPLP